MVLPLSGPGSWLAAGGLTIKFLSDQGGARQPPIEKKLFIGDCVSRGGAQVVWVRKLRRLLVLAVTIGCNRIRARGLCAFRVSREWSREAARRPCLLIDAKRMLVVGLAVAKFCSNKGPRTRETDAPAPVVRMRPLPYCRGSRFNEVFEQNLTRQPCHTVAY